MKKIYYLFAFVGAMAAFSACKPLSKTYDTLGDVPAPGVTVQSTSYSLLSTDYKLLNKGAAAYNSLYFKNTDTAKLQVPTILAKDFASYPDKSTITVTYGTSPVAIKLVDSTLATTVLPALVTTPTSDYRFPAYNGNAANTFDDFSATAALNYLRYKYQVPLGDPSLRLLTYLYFESNVTASAGTLTTDAFLFTNGDWQKIYRVKDAQYVSANRGTNLAFVSADVVNLPAYFNNFLKADITVMNTAKAGDVIYVNYKYQSSATVSYQRVLPLTYNGTNWSTAPIQVTLNFVKTNGVWVADNTVTYVLTIADMKKIGTDQPNVASTAAVANLASFGDYNIQGGATNWTDDQINTSISVYLKTKYGATAVLNQKYVITYIAYNGANQNVTKTWIYNGTDFVVQK